MKKNNLALLLIILFLAACSSTTHVKTRIELPRRTEVDLSGIDHFVITNFLLKNELEFDANQEFYDYFALEIEQAFDKQVSGRQVELDSEEIFEEADFWKSLLPDAQKTLFVAGTMEYTQETRKALVGKEKKQFDDPFPTKPTLSTRKFFTLKLSVFFKDAVSGKTLYSREFNETQASQNPNQTAYFAFFDLMHKVKEKLFRQTLGGVLVQERYLISK